MLSSVHKLFDKLAIWWLQHRQLLPTGPTALAKGLHIEGKVELYSGGILKNCTIVLDQPIKISGIGGIVEDCTIQAGKNFLYVEKLSYVK